MRGFLKSAAEALVYSSIWITICAMSMFENTAIWVIGTMRFRQLNIYIIASTLFLYSLHRLLSQKRITNPLEHYKNWFRRYRIYVIVLCALSGITAFVDYFFLPWREEIAFAFLGACALLYEVPALVIGKKRFRLRDLGLLKMVSIILVWIGSTVWIPIFKFTSAEASFQYWPLILAQTCFFTVLCLAFDERDSVYDMEQGIVTWAARIGARRLRGVYFLLLLFYVFFSWLATCTIPNVRLSLLWGVIATAALAYWMVLRPLKHPMFHYVFVDGLMIFQAGASLVALYHTG